MNIIKKWLGLHILHIQKEMQQGEIYEANQRIANLENNYAKLNEIILELKKKDKPKPEKKCARKKKE